MRFRPPILALLAAILVCVAATAQTYTLDPRMSIHKLNDVTSIMADTSNKLTIQDIASGKFHAAFKPLKGDTIENGTSYWLKFTVKSTAEIRTGG